MTKSDIIFAIFGESERAKRLESRKGKISICYLKKCLSLFESETEDKKDKAQDFIFALLMR